MLSPNKKRLAKKIAESIESVFPFGGSCMWKWLSRITAVVKANIISHMGCEKLTGENEHRKATVPSIEIEKMYRRK